MKQTRPPLVRMYAVDEELRLNRYPNCRVLADRFEVNPKTIQRDINYMRDMFGAPIAYDFRRRGFYYEKEWVFLPSAFLAEEEVGALKVTRKVLSRYRGTPYYREVSSALDKVLQYLPDTIAGSGFFDVYSFAPPTAENNATRHFAVLEDGIRQQLKVHIEYDAPTTGRVSERTVHPYRLHYAHDTWYLIARCELRRDVRAFVVRRMRRVELLRERYAPDPAFDVDAYIDGMFLQNTGGEPRTVQIRFSSGQAPWIRERRWHATQEIEEHPDGSLTLTMRVASLDAVASWVLHYGRDAEVLEPRELRERVEEEARAVAALYGGD